MMTSKMRIKLGPIEIEYEGSESFLKEEIPDLLSAVAKLYKESGVPANVQAHLGGGQPSGLAQGSTATFAAKLNVKSGPDLIVAACARMTLVSQQASFSRQQIIKEIQGATGYFKKTYINNLTTYLHQLVRVQKLVASADDTFALSIPTLKELELKFSKP
jgi:hypothetical protein